jgi:hypothetical protein
MVSRTRPCLPTGKAQKNPFVLSTLISGETFNEEK